MTDEMRAEFEVAFRAQFGFGAADIHEAKDAEAAAMMGCALWAWQASREAVAVVLPDEEPGYMYYAPDVLEAIEAQGLKVAP
ncbi:hypothetical protein OO256_22270 [Pseudomonas sp. DCB_CB]|uniref:hypothetical protein n=1 Tax=unclassified Pseudomonas TaxID=196821 RepID=UPI002248E11D|nr:MULTISPECIES: hypothetical protein [unclassified Pseudomonas]MCX2693682.1 hypothetical protein [Pseudomonas sp. DCB_BZ]MCX2858816.1 hypothetical protein [Pseudomonas sp. DCB_CB]